MKTLLIVDDERLFTQSLAEGLQSLDPSLRVLTVENGQLATEVLEAQAVDLVLTDLKMPVMDGFELLAHISRRHPHLPVLVMTAFGTPEIGDRLKALGVEGFIEKPVDFGTLSERIATVLESGASGFVRGIPLPTFLQIIEIERKTCMLRVQSKGRQGVLQFVNGALHDAETGSLGGEPAAAEIVHWEEASIEILTASGSVERRIKNSLGHILLEAFRVQDEKRARGERGLDPDRHAAEPGSTRPDHEKELIMSVTDKLKEFAAVEGFAGAGVFTPTGETLSILAAGTGFSKEIGILANNVLMNAQKATLEMGAGRGQQVHIEGEKAQILARCLNEGNDPLKSIPGKAHIHMVVALTNDASIGMAKMRMNSIIEKLAEDFRI